MEAATQTPVEVGSIEELRDLIGVEIGLNSRDAPPVSMPSSQVSRVPPAIGSRT